MGRKTTRSCARRYRAENGNFSGGPIAMVPCSHKCNIYIKMKLRVWRAQKFFPLVGAETQLRVQACKIPRLIGGGIGPRTKTCVNWGGPIIHGTVLAQRKCIYHKEVTGMESTEMYITSRCRNPTYLCGSANYTV